MSYNSHANPDRPLAENPIPDPWEPDASQIDTTPKAPSEFIRKIEDKIKHDSAHLMSSATPDVPRIAAPPPAEAFSADRVLLEDEVKIHGFARSRLGQAISKALALIWWSKEKPKADAS
jgi:hypothetical protein